MLFEWSCCGCWSCCLRQKYHRKSAIASACTLISMFSDTFEKCNGCANHCHGAQTMSTIHVLHCVHCGEPCYFTLQKKNNKRCDHKMSGKKRARAKDLPCLRVTQYSSFDRKRREQGGILKQHWNTYLRCVEYPNGVHVTPEGKVEPLRKDEQRLLFGHSSDEEQSDEQSDTDSDVAEFTPPPDPKRVQSTSTSDQKTMCVVCLEKEAVGVFQTCSHMCCCMVCGSHLESCPLCRAPSVFIHFLDTDPNTKLFT